MLSSFRSINEYRQIDVVCYIDSSLRQAGDRWPIDRPSRGRLARGRLVASSGEPSAAVRVEAEAKAESRSMAEQARRRPFGTGRRPLSIQGIADLLQRATLAVRWFPSQFTDPRQRLGSASATAQGWSGGG